MEEERAKVRVVRCPKCAKLLPELPNFSVYRCGGCSATLQAKKHVATSEASSSGKSNGEFAKYLENTQSCSENKGAVVSDASSDISPNVDRVEYNKAEKKLNRNESPDSDSGLVVATTEQKDVSKERKYRHSLKAPLDTKMPLENKARRDEGPSNYPNADSTEFLDHDRAELLRKLDELREQLRRSCKVAEKPMERTSVDRTTAFSSNPRHVRNRTSARIPPFANGHRSDIQNLYPAFHHGQYPQRPMNNYLYGQFDPDPLVSYHHDGFYHQPTCSCLHCHNGHWPRVQYPANNHGFYPVDSRYPNVPRAHQRATAAKKDGRACQPVAGADPFVSCYNCYELLQLPENFSAKRKLRCGSCSRIISFEFDGRILTLAPIVNDDTSRRALDSYSGDFDEKLVLPSFPVTSNLSESEKVSEDVDSPDSSTDLPLEAEVISLVPSLPLCERFGYALSDRVIDGSGNGSRSMRSDQEKVLTVNGIFNQISVKEMDSPDYEYPDDGLCRDQHGEKNNKSGDSFFAGFMKKRFKEGSKCKVSINGHPLSERLVKKAEKLAGPVHPGDYWYDYRCGFWGVIGHACLGIIPPFIEEFNYPMTKNCAGGNTDVLVNGRELHRRDLELLASRGLPVTEGCSYVIEISGKVWDEVSGEELDSLGKLAPTIEKVKHGFGMRVPRLLA